MTATGTDFSNPEGMYLDTVVVVDELCCYFLYLFDLELGFFLVGEGVCGFSVLGFFFGPCSTKSCIQKLFFFFFFFFLFFSSPTNSFGVGLEVAY